MIMLQEAWNNLCDALAPRVGSGGDACFLARYFLVRTDLVSAWAAGHIHSKLRNKLEPVTTDKLVIVYANSKIVSETRASGELTLFAWLHKYLDEDS